MSYTDFINENVAPSYATKIGVYNGDARIGKVDLGVLKKITGNKLYSFGLLSDVHNRASQSDENNADIQRALTYFNNHESVVFTCICGDVTYNGTESEFQQYKNNVDTYSPSTPVYTTVGNHDATTSGLNETLWQTYTGHGRCFEITKDNDYFIFFGMNKWSFGNNGKPFLETDIDWLENKLEEYRNERVFIFMHPFFPDRCGNYRNLYNNSCWLQGAQLTKLEELCDHYKNSIWFSGHSHWKWDRQKYEKTANIYKNNSGYCVHVPSCAYPRTDSNGTGSMAEKPLESEGAVVDVYENFIVIRGRDLKGEKYLPIAQYKLDTTITNIDAKATYTITNNLTNCTNSSTVVSVIEGKGYNANISANNGYILSNVTVTMGGTDITASCYNDGAISISNVTGNIVITANAVDASVSCTGITLNNNTLTFTTTDAQTLVATATPSNTTDKIVWSVSPTGVCTVNNGIVTPIVTDDNGKTGTCVVTVTCGTQSANCNVTVNIPSVYPYGFNYRIKIDKSTGVESTDTENYYSCSDFVEIDSATQIDTPLRYDDIVALGAPSSFTNYIICRVCYYDENKTFISCSSDQFEVKKTGVIKVPYTMNKPANAKYLKLRTYMGHTKEVEGAIYKTFVIS